MSCLEGNRPISVKITFSQVQEKTGQTRPKISYDTEHDIKVHRKYSQAMA